MKKVLNVGLIGFGMIGKVHAFGYATLPYYAPGLDVGGKIVAVATSRLETAERAKEILQCRNAYDDYRKIVADPSIDVVHICTPNAEHLPALIAAIRANKHIYCEKPIVSNAEEAARLREVLNERDSNGEFAYRGVGRVAFHLRGFAAIRRAKELIDAGRLGQILQYRVGYYHSSMTDPTAPLRWKHGASGGTILDLASHLLDLVDYLIGLPSELLAQSTTMCERRPTSAGSPTSGAVLAEDAVTVMTRGLREARRTPRTACTKAYEYAESLDADESTMPLAVADARSRRALTGVVEATKLSSGSEDELRLEISGSRGSLRFSLMDPHYLEYFDATIAPGRNGGDFGWKRIACGARYEFPESEFPSPKSTTGWIRAHVASLAAFYHAIGGGASVGADFHQALRVQDALDAVKRSAEERTWIKTF